MSIFDRVKQRIGNRDGQQDAALDGNRDTLRSGRYPHLQNVPVEMVPPGLVLTAEDKALATHVSGELVLSSARVGKHTVELLLCPSGSGSIDLCMRIPTAANQFKDPYILMEAEAGNSREDAAREINFHLQGRIDAAEIARARWSSILGAAALRLESLRKRA